MGGMAGAGGVGGMAGTTGVGGMAGAGGAAGAGGMAGMAGTGGSSIGSCAGPGATCAVATDCCNFQCTQGVCASAPSCIADNQGCTSSASCCSGACNAGTCRPLNNTCATSGNPCGPDAGATPPCCSGLCTNGKCALGASWCIQPGDVCGRDTDCCTGWCQRATGATVGVCKEPGTTGAGSCQHDGVICNGCGSCCSKICAPWPLSGIDVCQPGLGCKILNSLCTSAAECCGGSTGEVTCNPVTGPTDISIGVCAQNHGNQVPGGICKLPGGNACTNAQSDCDCPVSPKVQCCAFDRLGLPRCLGSGTCSSDGGTGVYKGSDPSCCRKAGDTCSTSAECCNLAPCVPDSTGTYRCLTSTTDGGPACVRSGNTCTATGDCCAGLICFIEVGAPSGTCVPPRPTGGDGGIICGLLGQNCNSDTPCCNNVPCMYAPTNTPCDGQNDCTCYTP